MKKLVAFSIVAVLCLSLQSVAAVVIGDFENDMDGWVLQQGATSVYSSTVGVTSGASSLELTVAGDWKESMKKSIISLVDVMKVAQSITLDYTSRNENAQIPDWWMQGILRLNGDACGYVDLDKGWDGVDWSPTTRHVTWTIPQSVRDSFNNNPSTWCEVLLYTNCGANGGTFWIDNVQIVPEPATLSMLGLGALALLKRRKA